MRINSTRGSRMLRFIYMICVSIIFFDILILNIDGSWGTITKLSPLAVLVIVFIIYRGLPQFLYDSDGEVLNFTAREPNFDFLGNRFVHHTEFPKRKLEGYKISRYPLKRKLTLYIKSKEQGVKKRRVGISYLSLREVRDLKRSLDKVLANNRKKKNGRK